MTQDEERQQRIVAALREANLPALVCTLPENVLLLTGYWPVVGTAVAVATADGHRAVLAPEDEEDLARSGWAEVRTYAPGKIDSLAGPAEFVRAPLGKLLADLGVDRGRIGVDDTSNFEPVTYSAMFLFGVSIRDVVVGAAPAAETVSGWGAVSRLRSAYTPREVDVIRRACAVAGDAYTAGTETIRPGRREPDVATAIASDIEIRGLAEEGVQRTVGHVWCMSGPNSALAGAAYARTRNRELREGDLILVHCNSVIDGLWTDITRTFSLGEPDERQRAIHDAIFAAREAALAAVRPGARAADVDAAGRKVLEERGFGQYFTHGIGHNVGFSAISGEFPPRLRPGSPDVLEPGMTFNVEPSIYIHGYGGVRHCDVVTVTDGGAEVLTPFLADLASVTITL